MSTLGTFLRNYLSSIISYTDDQIIALTVGEGKTDITKFLDHPMPLILCFIRNDSDVLQVKINEPRHPGALTAASVLREGEGEEKGGVREENSDKYLVA